MDLGGVVQTARWTLFALMHEVQTFKRFGAPFTSARTVWMFGIQRRLVLLCEWLIVLPNFGDLPQTSHTWDMILLRDRSERNLKMVPEPVSGSGGGRFLGVVTGD